MLPDALLSSIGLLDANSISDLDEKSFVFLGKKGGNASIADNSYTEYISKWNAFSYEPNTFFQYDTASSGSASVSATLWIDEGEFSFFTHLNCNILFVVFSIKKMNKNIQNTQNTQNKQNNRV